MKRFSDYMLSEKVTAIIAFFVIIGVFFGIFVGSQQGEMVQRAELSISEARKQLSDMVAERSDSQSDPSAEVPHVPCDNSLIEAKVLANDYLTLKIRPTPVEAIDLKKGYAPGIYIWSKLEEDGGDTYGTANRLFKAIKKQAKDTLRKVEIDKENKSLEFSILLSEKVRCSDKRTTTGTNR